MVSPRKEHSGATKHCGSGTSAARPQEVADDILDLALKALDDAHGGGRALLARGAGSAHGCCCGPRPRKNAHNTPAYLRSVAWSLNELDAFEAAALRLKASAAPGPARLRAAADC